MHTSSLCKGRKQQHKEYGRTMETSHPGRHHHYAIDQGSPAWACCGRPIVQTTHEVYYRIFVKVVQDPPLYDQSAGVRVHPCTKYHATGRGRATWTTSWATCTCRSHSRVRSNDPVSVRLHSPRYVVPAGELRNDGGLFQHRWIRD